MSKKIISILFCVILACTAGTACSKSSDASESSVTESSFDLDIPSNAILAEERPLQEIFEADKTDSSAATNVVYPYIPKSSQSISTGEDGRNTDPERSVSQLAGNGMNKWMTVNDPSSYPFSAIAQMIVGAKCGCTWECNGAMVGPRGLITSAKCLVCAKHHATLDKAVFCFGDGDGGNYIYRYDGPFRYWFGTDFTENGGVYSTENDYGYVLFEERIGDTTGWFGVCSLPDDQITRKSFKVAAYHYGSMDFLNSYASAFSPSLIKLTANAGSSRNAGAPVYFYNENGPYVTAVYAVSDQTQIFARRITQEMIEYMKSQALIVPE